MIPDEEPGAPSEPAPTTAEKGRRRSRRGGRRHSNRRRAPRPAVESPAAESAPNDPGATEEPGGTATAYAEREPETLRETSGPRAPARVSDAIEQVTRVIEELKLVLNEMEEVLETLELAERQKIDDEREIEALTRSLRQLHRPSAAPSSQRRH